MGLPDFLKPYKKKLKDISIKEIIFSENTYEVEVIDKQKTLWPFLQIDDEGNLTDSFCTCKQSEKEHGCVHLAAAYLRICHREEKPLHIWFRQSLWNSLCQVEAEVLGYDTKVLKKKKLGHYVTIPKEKEAFFLIQAKTKKSTDILEEIVSKRVLETEETSLKFSNLSVEELAQWKQGKVSHHLRYELSFWSDIAKWLFLLQDKGEKYSVSIIDNDQNILEELIVKFNQVEVQFKLEKKYWHDVIFSFSSIDSSIEVKSYEDQIINKIVYDKEKKGFLILKKESERKAFLEKGKRINGWIYFPKVGFYSTSPNTFFDQDFIEEKDVALSLSSYLPIFSKFLKDEIIHDEPIDIYYNLFFDEKKNLHIDSYLFDKGDLDKKGAAYFINWAYLPDKGFYKLLDHKFLDVHKIISKEKVSDFINRERNWLYQFEGFQPLFGSLQSQLTYSFKDNQLCFHSHLEASIEKELCIDFEEWVYLKNKGFYKKSSSKSILTIQPGVCIDFENISSFIDSHREELEQITNFFISQNPIKTIGVTIHLNDDMNIVIAPKEELAEGFNFSDLTFFDHYIYIEKQGFFIIPNSLRLPKKYQKKEIVPISQEKYFLKFELEKLLRFALDVDKRLIKPKFLNVDLRKISREKKKSGEYILLDIIYSSDIGEVSAYDLWKPIFEKKSFAFTQAGLIDLSHPRFNWILTLKKRRLHRTKKLLRLNMLEWIRLCSFEIIKEPQGDSREDKKMRKLFHDINSFEEDSPIDISLLQATLRPYQETGLKWLWFLYAYQLSGMLCDEMGLGKTHQAMALIAAIYKEKKDKKFLVICPTSVIYHWEELFKKFFPSLKVYVYHGFTRKIKNFSDHYDLLLTSYGILRLETEVITKIQFEVVVFDEMQIAKNYYSKTNKSLRMLKARMRLGLTGTPIENYLRELKALFDVILPNYLPKEQVFKEFFSIPIEKQNDEKRRSLLKKLIKPFVLRRKKAEVLLDLPEKVEEIAYCDLSNEQIELYNQMLNLSKKQILSDLYKENKPISYVHIFSLLTKLKQICDHPSLILKDVRSYQKHQSGKWDLFVELLNETRESKQKLVVFSQYLDMLEIIEIYLKKKKIGFASIKGSTKNRAEEIRRFQEDLSCEVFVGSLLAAGVGINLSAASVVIHYDRWWNPAKENQATDRVHRIGQNRGVQVFKLVAKNTIEERIHQIIERKKGLIEETIGKDDSDEIKKLTREDIIAALKEIPFDEKD